MKKYFTSKKHLFHSCALMALIPLSASAGGYSIQTGHVDTHRQNAPYIAISAGDEVAQGAQNFIENVSSRGLSFLQNENLDEAGRKKEFGKLLRDSFDLKTIGRFALGTYWRQADDAQKDEYINLFEDMVINTYAKRFKEYQGQQVAVDRARPEGDKDTIVNSRIVSTDGAPDVQLDWRVRYKNGQYRIIDVLVEGVSMSLTQRSEFSSIIQRGGGNIEALLVKLRER